MFKTHVKNKSSSSLTYSDCGSGITRCLPPCNTFLIESRSGWTWHCLWQVLHSQCKTSLVEFTFIPNMLISVSSLTCSLQALSVSFLPGSELMRVGILEYQVPSVEAVDGSGFNHDEHFFFRFRFTFIKNYKMKNCIVLYSLYCWGDVMYVFDVMMWCRCRWCDNFTPMALSLWRLKWHEH